VPPLSDRKLGELLAHRPAGAVFFFAGDEEYLREATVARVVEAFLDPATRDFNFDQLRGGDVAAEALASVLATPPLMAEHRVVVIRDVAGLSTKARDVVLATAESPPAGLALVVAGAVPSGSRAKFYPALQKSALSMEFRTVEANDLPAWLVQQASDAYGLDLELPAARALASAIGSQLGVLGSELAKLAAYVQGRSAITVEDVRAVVGYIPRVDRWAWFDLVAERRIGEALGLLPTLLDAGESGVGLVIGMAGQILRVGLAVAGGRDALERELNPRQRWLANRIVPLARRWSMEDVDFALEEMLRTDRLLKTAPLSDRQAIEELLLRLLARFSADHGAALPSRVPVPS
jgi:DNA polymerase-3 subunit delta